MVLLLISILLAGRLAQPAPPVALAADGWSSAQQLTNDQIGNFPDINDGRSRADRAGVARSQRDRR